MGIVPTRSAVTLLSYPALLPPSGHACAAKCHTGLCPPCTTPVEATCRCGTTHMACACHEAAAARMHWADPDPPRHPHRSTATGAASAVPSSTGLADVDATTASSSASSTVTATPTAAESALHSAAPSSEQPLAPTATRSSSPLSRSPSPHEGVSSSVASAATLSADTSMTVAGASADARSTAATASTAAPPLPPGAPTLLCGRVCHAMRSCGRHRCDHRCCELLRKPGITTGAHECKLPCNRLLSCHKHRCSLSCHGGRCPPCNVISYEEWRCPCGRTVVDPPIFCHTVLPACPFPCSVPRPCGHPPHHDCHSTSQPCPPCMVRHTALPGVSNLHPLSLVLASFVFAEA